MSLAVRGMSLDTVLTVTQALVDAPQSVDSLMAHQHLTYQQAMGALTDLEAMGLVDRVGHLWLPAGHLLRARVEETEAALYARIHSDEACQRDAHGCMCPCHRGYKPLG